MNSPSLSWKEQSLVVVGCGNMARAVVTPLSQAPYAPRIFTYTPSFTSAAALALKVGGVAYREITEIPEGDVYLLGMKPQQLAGAGEALRGILPKHALVISMLAGTSLFALKKHLGVSKIIRTMPNTPCLLGEGVVGLFAAAEVSESERALADSLFSSVALSVWFEEEEKIDQITNVTASGPAYFFELARTLVHGLEKNGIEAGLAQKLVGQTMLGAGKMLLESVESAETLREQVTSKKGVTFEALEVFKRHGLERIVDEALRESYRRVLELKALGEE